IVKGTLQANNPMRGIIPVIVQDPKIEKILTVRPLAESISEIHELYTNPKNSVIQIPLDWATINQLFPDAASMGIIPYIKISHSSLKRIIENVRNLILNWALELEKDGILGEGFTFTEKEKDLALSSLNNYGTIIYGNQLGQVMTQSNSNNSKQEMQNTYNTWHEYEKLLEIINSNKGVLDFKNKGDLANFESLLGNLSVSIKDKDHFKFKNLISTLRNVLEGVTGSLIASGIIYEIDKVVK
ncbi:hypothetical protein, partial [Leptospira semungkisensis]|uniref:AbiTii domain-containing protein n=1 Tax=Leptospira semungkisensis TaxID=2484985 RepID=UPI00143850CA